MGKVVRFTRIPKLNKKKKKKEGRKEGEEERVSLLLFLRYMKMALRRGGIEYQRKWQREWNCGCFV